MNGVQSAAAFEAYLAIRHRLPSATIGKGWQRRSTLGDIVAPFDHVLLDAYGVLNVGETPIAGAVERIAALREAGKAVTVVSNSAGYPKRLMMERYHRLGFDFAPSQVVTSREVLLNHLKRMSRLHWGMMLDKGHGIEELEGISTSFLEEDPAEYDAAEGFLLIGSDGWNEQRQSLLEDSLRRSVRPVLVGNPDIVAPREDGLSFEPGHFAHRLADATGIAPVFLGKPFPSIFDLAMARHEVPVSPERVLMVGDTLHTDILGGRHMGFATALVLDHGSLAGLDVEDAILRSGLTPDFVIDRI